MSKHTPGPWRVLPDVDSNRDSARIFADSKYIGIIGNSDDTHEQTDTNARLVAAAPDLLKILEFLNNKGGLGLDVHKEIDEVIARVKGENE